MLKGNILSPDRKPFYDQEKEAKEFLITDPTSAQIQLWQAQSQRDHGLISARNMEEVERLTKPQAEKCVCLYNPFTGKINRMRRDEFYKLQNEQREKKTFIIMK